MTYDREGPGPEDNTPTCEGCEEYLEGGKCHNRKCLCDKDCYHCGAAAEVLGDDPLCTRCHLKCVNADFAPRSDFAVCEGAD